MPTKKAASSKNQSSGKITKIAKVIDLLQRKQGATLSEIIEATGWQLHSARAALTGLRKKGQVIEKTKRDDATCYRITRTV